MARKKATAMAKKGSVLPVTGVDLGAQRWGDGDGPREDRIAVKHVRCIFKSSLNYHPVTILGYLAYQLLEAHGELLTGVFYSHPTLKRTHGCVFCLYAFNANQDFANNSHEELPAFKGADFEFFRGGCIKGDGVRTAIKLGDREMQLAK